jgi:hypothetical protein
VLALLTTQHRLWHAPPCLSSGVQSFCYNSLTHRVCPAPPSTGRLGLLPSSGRGLVGQVESRVGGVSVGEMEMSHCIKSKKTKEKLAGYKLWGALVITFVVYESYPPPAHLYCTTPSTVHVFECVFLHDFYLYRGRAPKPSPSPLPSPIRRLLPSFFSFSVPKLPSDRAYSLECKPAGPRA